MTGQELFAALSFVDERYIAEADAITFRKNTPWMKVLSVAACLCILITGVYAYGRMQSKGAMESIHEFEAAAPAAPRQEAALEEAAPAEAPAATEAAPRQESETEAAKPESALAAAGELQHVPYAKLLVVEVLEDGSFDAIVKATQEMEADTPVKVVVDPSMVPGEDREIANDLSVITEGALLEIFDGAYDAEANTLYVAEVFLEEGE